MPPVVIEAVSRDARPVRRVDRGLREAMSRPTSILRSRVVITLELAAIGVALLAMAVIPQGTQDPPTTAFARVVSALWLDRIAIAPWFIALLAVAAVSLVVILGDQVRVAVRLWRAPLDRRFLARCQYRTEFTRTVTTPRAVERYRRHGRASLLGPPLLHLGLLLLLVAGLVRALMAAEATAEVVDGETLASGPGVWAIQRAAPFSWPIGLDTPLRVEGISPVFYPTGRLDRLTAAVGVGDSAGRSIAINAPLRFGTVGIYLTQVFGPAALVEWHHRGTKDRTALLLAADSADGRWAGRADLEPGTELRVRTALGHDGDLPMEFEVRIIREGHLAAVSSLRPGDQLTVPSGGRLSMVGSVWWARLDASRDLSTPVATAGFGAVVVGAILIFGCARIQTAVVVEPGGPTVERVIIGLWAARDAPLYEDRFRRVVDRERGTRSGGRG